MKKILFGCLYLALSVTESVCGVPVYQWSGKDSVKIEEWLVLEPVRLVGKNGVPITDLDEDPSTGNRLLSYLFDDYEMEEKYLNSPSGNIEPYSYKHWNDYRWSVVKTDSDGWFRADSLARARTDNAISFGVVDINVSDSIIAGLKFAFGFNGFLFVNGQMQYSGQNSDGFPLPGYMKAVKYVYLAPGRNRIVFKVDDMDGKLGGKLLVTPPADPVAAANSLKELFSREESSLLKRKRDEYLALPSLTDEEIAKIKLPQDSLKKIIRYLVNELRSTDRMWQSTRNARYGKSYIVHLETMLQMVKLVRAAKNPLPNLVGPVYWAYWSEVTESVVPFHMYVPERKTRKKLCPLMIGLHGSNGISFQFLNTLAINTTPPPSTFVLSPTGRGNSSYQGAGEADVVDLITLLKRNFPVDPSRISITGSSMGGMGTYYLMQVAGDLFSCALPLAGAIRELSMVSNLSNRPVWSFHGSNDLVLPYTWSEAAKSMIESAGGNYRYSCLSGAGHGLPFGFIADSGTSSWAVEQIKPESPDSVRLSGRGNRVIQMDWLRVDRPLDVVKQFRITAIKTGKKTVSVNTVNVKAFTLIAAGKLKEVTVNGKIVAVNKRMDNLAFVFDNEGVWSVADSKLSGTIGPAGDIFSMSREPLLFVYSTASPAKTAFVSAVAESLAKVDFGNFPVIADTLLTRERAYSKNLFLVSADIDEKFAFVGSVKEQLKNAPCISQKVEGKFKESIFAFHTKHPLNSGREMAVFCVGADLSDQTMKRLNLRLFKDVDACLFDANLNVIDYWVLQHDWTEAPEKAIESIDGKNEVAVADTVLSFLCKRSGVEKGLLIMEPMQSADSSILTNKQLKWQLKDQLPVILDAPGSEIKEIARRGKIERFTIVQKIFTRGFDVESLEDNRDYRIVVGSDALWQFRKGHVVQALPVPVYDAVCGKFDL